MDIPLYYNRSKITSDKNLSVCEVSGEDEESHPPGPLFQSLIWQWKDTKAVRGRYIRA